MSMSDARAGWLAELAHADRSALEAAWQRLGDRPAPEHLRPPEFGLAMVRGRMGGSGRRFNLGEMTVSRCAVRIGAAIGHGYVAGRDRRKAELVAVFDALLQDEHRRGGLLRDLIRPLAASRAARAAVEARKSAATRVEFFTLVRGDE
jgi:alpha-D-ribose 1-methylphosphonate 5-triphosphate synthase subunit PhnG